MGVLRRTRQAQYPLVAEFVFNYTDGMTPLVGLDGPSVDLNRFPGVTDFGSGQIPTGMLTSTVWTLNPGANTTYFEILTLPNGAQVIGGDVQVEAPYLTAGTVTLSLGNQNSANLYLPSQTPVSLKAAALGGAITAAVNNITPAGQTVVDPRVTQYTFTTALTGVVPGGTMEIVGMTPAAYNGNFVVEAVAGEVVTVTNPQLTATLAATAYGTASFILNGRTALNIPDEITNLTSLNANFGPVQFGEEAASGTDVRMGLTFGSAAPAATQGRVRIRVMYTIDGKMSEVATQ